LGAGWQLQKEDVFGEFYLRQHLELLISGEPATVDDAATGWGGDRYAVYRQASTQELAMILAHAWDTEQDAVEFVETYADYVSRRVGATEATQPDGGRCWQGVGEVTCLYQTDEQSLIVQAPDLDTATAVATVVLSA
jgi:hypothetical protein